MTALESARPALRRGVNVSNEGVPAWVLVLPVMCGVTTLPRATETRLPCAVTAVVFGARQQRGRLPSTRVLFMSSVLFMGRKKDPHFIRKSHVSIPHKPKTTVTWFELIVSYQVLFISHDTIHTSKYHTIKYYCGTFGTLIKRDIRAEPLRVTPRLVSLLPGHRSCTGRGTQTAGRALTGKLAQDLASSRAAVRRTSRGRGSSTWWGARRRSWLRLPLGQDGGGSGGTGRCVGCLSRARRCKLWGR